MRRANIPIHSIKEYISLLTQGGETLDKVKATYDAEKC